MRELGKVRRAFDMSTHGPGGGARQPRRRRGDRASAAGERRGPTPSCAAVLARHGLDPVGPRRGELPLRRHGRRHRRARGRPAARGRHHPAADGLRRAGRGADHGGDRRGPRRSRHGPFGRRRRRQRSGKVQAHVSSAPAHRQTGLLRRNPGFRALFAATFASGLGTWIAVVALTIDVYDRTGSATWVSALLVADFLPSVAIGLLFGPLIDRLSRRRIMVVADLAQGWHLRCAPVHEQPRGDRGPRRRRRLRDGLLPAGLVRRSAEPRHRGRPRVGELAAPRRRLPVVDDRDGDRRHHRRRFEPRRPPTGSTRRRSSSRRRFILRIAPSRSRRRGPSREATGETWATGSRWSSAHASCSRCSARGIS